MNDGDRGLASSRAGASTPPPLPQPPPTVRRTGPPNDILQYCPENSPVLFPLEWYRLPQVPNFLICNFCHAKHIRQSSFASSFEGVRQQEGTATLCRFCVPRVKNVLWPEAVRSGDLAPFTAYAIKRARISDCCGEEGVSAAAGIKWLVAKNSLAPHFLTCEACFEDRIVGSAFESQLEPPQLGQRTGQTWTCDVGSTGYISRAFEKFGTKGRNDWPACVAAINNRLPLPVCEGKNVDRDCNKWFTPRREIYDFAICETCYLDKVALTEFEHEFTAWAAPKQSTLGLLGGALLQGRAPQAPQCVCDMTGMPISAALDAALMRHDFSVWWNAANAIRRAPACTTNGLRGGTWYTLQGGCNDFDICTACHAGIVRPLGLDQFFQQGTRTGDEVVVCDFCPVQPRFPHLMIHLVRSLLVGVFEHFESYVRKWSGIPLCQGRKPLENCIWYGFYDAAFCTNCYEEVVAGSALDSALAVRGVRVTGRTMCCLYSPRMRQKWRDACAAGSPDGFIAAAKYRMEVYQKTIPKVELMEAVKLSKVATSAHQAVLSVQYQGMAGLAELSGSTDAYWHRYGGNYYSTWDGAHSAQLSDASRAGLMDAIRGDDIVLKAQLLTMWKQVE
ncbi:hypothetical protein GQ53DRAFT_722413 [Thozetella sp. PMI_491]|nr:hypothetical protein GQ53DRAFT_722413 [Thozetella sp. PMI_491]